MAKKIYERPVIVKQYGGLMNKFGSAPLQPPMTEIDTIPVKNLLQDYGSPLFVFSEKKIRDNQRKMHRIFKTRYPKVQFAWSYKTNYLSSICSVFHQEGSWAEVVSEYEYNRAEKLGIPGEFIVFNGPDKNRAALEKAIKNKSKIHIDHFDELYEIIELTESLDIIADVAIRINMDVGIYPLWDRFGFNYENGEALQAVKRIINCENLNLIGLHTHIGTYMMTTEPYHIAATKMVELANYIKSQYNIVLDYIDMGGGLPSQNTLKGQYLNAEQLLPSYEEYADAITKALFNYNVDVSEMPTLILESGRALIDDAGFLLSSVIGNKRLSSGKKAVIIDAGVNLLFTSFWFKHKIVPAQQSNGTFTENSAIYGPLCMNIDCLSEDIVLPALNKGDQVVIQHVGAYSVTQWMQFITVRPKVVMIMEDKSIEIIRDSETFDYLSKMEKRPNKLESFNL
jgi:diaminopimelate decarboxylase